MKTNRLCSSILLLLPSLAFSMGLGDMNVTSFLNQQFHAEIPLLDVGSVPLSGIRVTLASLDEFERIGLNRAELLDYLQFRVIKNDKGQSVIQITSTERITEPYLQILVDLAWTNGQLYRSYTVLLDPPNYKIDFTQQPVSQSAPVKHYYANEPGVIEKPVYTQVVNTDSVNALQHEDATYGPTLVHESIWQIAQRYSTPSVSMPQIILAIVGTNSQAFTQGNLNGLKAGERLSIPSTKEIMKIPADLAKQEVEAHDLAWNTNQLIKHVILPPYIGGEKGISQFEKNNSVVQGTLTSELPKTPILAQEENKPVVENVVKSETPAILSAPQPVINNEIIPGSYLPSITTIPVATPTITSEAFEQIRHENSLLKEELDKLKAVKSLQVKTIIPPKTSSVVISQQQTDTSNTWLYPALLAAVIAGVGFGYRITTKRRDDEPDATVSNNIADEPITPVFELANEPKQTDASIHFIAQEAVEDPIVQEPVSVDSSAPTTADTIPEIQSVEVADEQVNFSKEKEPSADNYLLDFEPGLDKFIYDAPASDEVITPDTSYITEFDDVDMALHKAPATTHELDKLSDDLASDISADLQLNDNQDDSYEFHPEVVSQTPLSTINITQEQESFKPVKSQTALDTLLALAKTYIAMDDFDTARQSLQEVLDFGNEIQQKAAKILLDELNAK